MPSRAWTGGSAEPAAARAGPEPRPRNASNAPGQPPFRAAAPPDGHGAGARALCGRRVSRKPDCLESRRERGRDAAPQSEGVTARRRLSRGRCGSPLTRGLHAPVGKPSASLGLWFSAGFARPQSQGQSAGISGEVLSLTRDLGE